MKYTCLCEDEYEKENCSGECDLCTNGHTDEGPCNCYICIGQQEEFLDRYRTLTNIDTVAPDHKQLIIQHLLQLADSKIQPTCPDVGICSELNYFAQLHDIPEPYPYQLDTYQLIKVLSQYWPKHSGDPAYPIPSSDPDLSAEVFYYECSNLWTREQGNLRRELCRYMAKTLTQLM